MSQPTPDKDLFSQLQECVDQQIRPFIQMDGGDIELLELVQADEYKILRVRLQGACVGCMASSMTLQYGVQNALNEAFPDEDIQLELVQTAAEANAEPHAPPQRFID